jgi:hypothetical protein
MTEHFGWEQTYDEQIRQAYRLIARHVYRTKGVFAYCAFEYVNATFFSNRLPEPLILWDLTDWGKCLGWTRSPKDGPPIIKLHPSLIDPSADPRQRQRWSIPLDLLGHCYAYLVLIHECIHASVNYLLGGFESHPGHKSYWTSHNNPLWIGEVNRIAAAMGWPAINSMKRYRWIDTGLRDEKGKPITKQAYISDGPDFERFPHDVPGVEDFCRAGILPFSWDNSHQAQPAHAAGKSGCAQ